MHMNQLHRQRRAAVPVYTSWTHACARLRARCTRATIICMRDVYNRPCNAKERYNRARERESPRGGCVCSGRKLYEFVHDARIETSPPAKWHFFSWNNITPARAPIHGYIVSLTGDHLYATLRDAGSRETPNNSECNGEWKVPPRTSSLFLTDWFVNDITKAIHPHNYRFVIYVGLRHLCDVEIFTIFLSILFECNKISDAYVYIFFLSYFNIC